MDTSTKTNPLVTLLPLLVFVATFLGAGIFLSQSSELSFYELPSPIAAVVGLAAAFLLFKSDISTKVNQLIAGCGQPQIVTMCLIFLLAGGFATLTKSIGGVDAVAYFGAKYFSLSYIYATFFFIASFVSFASGTSVGAITALGPVAASFLAIDSINGPLLAASFLGGAMFGDNLSLISDTTIAATQTQECSMKDKFRVNSRIAFPAAILTFTLLLVIGFSLHHDLPVTTHHLTEVSFVYALPYFVVILLAIFGVNVLVNLFIGMLTAAVIGLFAVDMSVLTVAKTAYDGFSSMNEIFLLSMLSAGLIYMVDQEGGIRYIIDKVTKFATTKSRTYVSMAGLISMVDAAIANNTVTILVCGPVANRLRKQQNIAGDHASSLLDITSCIVQGVIPWGAQMLILQQQMGPQIGYLEIVTHSYYLIALGGCTIAYFGLMPFFSKAFDEVKSPKKVVGENSKRVENLAT